MRPSSNCDCGVCLQCWKSGKSKLALERGNNRLLSELITALIGGPTTDRLVSPGTHAPQNRVRIISMFATALSDRRVLPRQFYIISAAADVNAVLVLTNRVQIIGDKFRLQVDCDPSMQGKGYAISEQHSLNFATAMRSLLTQCPTLTNLMHNTTNLLV